MSDLWSSRVLLRFHLRTGVRVGLRTLVPLVGGLVAAAVLYGNPWILFAALAAVLFPPTPSLAAALGALAIVGGSSAPLAPRIVRGVDGWARHLPTRAVVQRRAVMAGVAVAASPMAFLIAAGGAFALATEPSQATFTRLLGLPILAASAALAVLPVRRKARCLAALAAGLSFFGSPWALVAASALLWLADRVAGGEIVSKRSSRARRVPSRPGSPSRILMRISLRALRGRLISCWAFSVLSLIPLAFFLSNNELSQGQAGLAVRCAALIGCVLAQAGAADALVKQRPPWPWLRSLPVSARRRVALDAVLLGVVAMPALVVGGLLRPAAFLSIAAVLPFLALRSATAIRVAPGKMSGASGPILLEGSLTSVLVAVLPATAVLIALLSPMALRWAAASERNQDISTWFELHHAAAGDTMAWSGS